MSRQQDVADEIRRAMHDRLVAELRLRQRNIVFPYTVRNEGLFYRTLASKSIHSYMSHKIFAFLVGFFYILFPIAQTFLLERPTFGLGVLSLLGNVWSLLFIFIGLKISVNAVFGENDRRKTPGRYPRVKI